MIAFNRYCYQFDTYLGCYAILAITNKSIYGYILRNMDNHQLESLIRTVRLVKAHSMKLKK